MRRASGALEDAVTVLRSRRFLVETRSDRVLGRRNGVSVLAGSVFHLGIPVLALGLLLHGATFGSTHFRVIEGQSTDDALVRAQGTGRWQALPATVSSMTLESVEPAYFRDVLLFERLDAALRDDRTGSTKRFSLASPAWLDPFTMVSIQDFGIAPHLRVYDAKGEAEEDVVLDMAIFPPGEQDTADLPLSGYRATIVLYPDYGQVGGRDVSLSYNVRNPKMLVGLEQANRPGMVITRRLVSVGERIPGYQRAFEVVELRYYGELRVWRSYGWPLVVLAALMLVGGLVGRILLPREDMVIWALPGGLGMSARVDGRGRAGAAALLDSVAERIEGATAGRSSATGPSDDGFAAPDEDAFEEEEARP